MPLLDVHADARRAMDVMRNAGIAILPNDVGYSLIAARHSAVRKIFDTKKRAPSKLNAMLGNEDLHRELHLVSARGREIVEGLLRYGSCFENIADILQRHFRIELPPRHAA